MDWVVGFCLWLFLMAFFALCDVVDALNKIAHALAFVVLV
jgi:hypothetical protein